jgi:CheY-like chemotaxis protein
VTAREQPITDEDIFACTPAGRQAADDAGRALSAGFRQMLKALDGRRTVGELGKLFPNLDQQDMVLWLEELRRLQFIAPAQVLFELPEARPAKPARAPAPGEFNVDEMAANMADWVQQSTEAFTKVKPAELNKTIQMATLQSSQALENLEDSGFVYNLMEPIAFDDAAPPPPRKPPAPAAKKKLAMVFEDDTTDLLQLVKLIEAAGYLVQAAGSRQEFVNLLNSPAAPNVMFLKLGAEEVDGFKALEKMRVHPRLKDVAVVMMAAKPSREDIAKSILLGASGWMIKPYSADLIAAAVQGVLAFPAQLALPPD